MRPARTLAPLLLLAIAACTGAARTSAPSTVTASPPTTTIDYGVQFLADSAPATDALTRLEGTTAPTSADFNSAESASEALPYQLLAETWPSKAQRDISGLASAWGAIVADCRLLALVPAGDTSSLRSDETKLSAKVRIVRADLQLPT
jgi:hypothetical protein